MSEGDNCSGWAFKLRPISQSANRLPLRQLKGLENGPPKQVNAEDDPSEPDTGIHSPSVMGLDEIVVNFQANRGPETTPPRSVSTNQEQAMDVVGYPSSTVSNYPKRKRDDLAVIETDASPSLSATEESPSLYGDCKSQSGRQGLDRAVLGYWRDSEVPEESRKHAVIGFIDVSDRLRLLVQPKTKGGESLAREHPLSPKPHWVTLERVVLSDHLARLDYNQIKEYTRIRPENTCKESEEEQKTAEQEAVQEAIRRVEENSAPTAYGADVPKSLSTPGRPCFKRCKTGDDLASVTPLPGSRPTHILIGCWKVSKEANRRDRPAVYGTLCENDLFRAKLVRETRDGRSIMGNFPVGARSLWIPLEEVELEEHLTDLNQRGVKEYCRIRQYQMDHGETETDRISNETKAVDEAQTRADIITSREIAMMEAAQRRADHYALRRGRTAATGPATAAAAVSAPAPDGRTLPNESQDTPDARRQSGRVRPGADHVKTHHGVRYERKSRGPFAGKLVSQGRMISIDGEDYVEYRILTKPSFF